MRSMVAAAILTTACAAGAAQTSDQQAPVYTTVQQQQAAPVERAYPTQNAYPSTYPAGQMSQRVGPPQLSSVAIAPGQDISPAAGEAQATPIDGVVLRVGPQSTVQEVSSDTQKLELRVERGIANINVYKPAKDTLILVDLPGGQTQLLKNGFYTFDANTDTARVLKGEALAFPAATPGAKPMKVKQDNKIVYSGAKERPHEFVPYEASVDLLPGPEAAPDEGSGGAGSGYGYGAFDDGFYPSYAYGYPWGWGGAWDPYGFGFYPGIGIGLGYYGGYGYGGYGGYGYGFHDGDHDGDYHGGGYHGGAGGLHGGGYHGGGFRGGAAGFRGGGGGGFHGGGGGFHGGGGGFHGGGGGRR